MNLTFPIVKVTSKIKIDIKVKMVVKFDNNIVELISIDNIDPIVQMFSESTKFNLM